MTQLEVRDESPFFGAEVSGFKPDALRDADTCQTLCEAFDRRGALVFRDLEIDHPAQVHLCEMLIGKRGLAGTASATGALPDDNFYISNKRPDSAAPHGRLRFHSDTMWSDQPFQVLSLYAVDVVQPAVPTVFVSAAHAWKTLPADLRARVEGARAKHTAGEVMRGTESGDVLVSHIKRPPSTTQSIGYRHPRTGENLLYICEQMTEKIVGLEPDASEHLLEELFAHLYDPAVRWEHHWRNLDLIVWDNLALQHARPAVQADGPARTLRKVASPIPPLSQDQIPDYGSTR